MERLECHVQNYAWGKKGMHSEVARVYAAGHNVQIDEGKSYAELWMGTHPDGPARIRHNNVTLSRHIAESESSVYDINRGTKENHLPFIMKLMSIEKTLSIQVHPTKEQAAKLNDRDPVHYPDRNHKPELAYALTRFELLCGFRPATEISANMSAFPELKELMGSVESRAFQALVDVGINQECAITKAALKECFKNLIKSMQTSASRVAELLGRLLERFDSNERGCLTEGTVEVIRKMALDFPGDVGCFCPLILNHMILESGECCYYAAEELHAYLSGECVECVGCSNNTIRAACTPKFVDVEALCEILNYRMTEPSFYLVPPVTLKDFPEVDEYAPDCKDFTLHQIKVEAEKSTDSLVAIPSLTCASIMVIVDGKGCVENLSERSNSKKVMKVARGDIVYIPPRAQICFTDCSTNILAYRTFSYEKGPDHSLRNTEHTIETTSKLKVRKNGRAKYLVVDGSAQLFDLETEMDGFS